MNASKKIAPIFLSVCVVLASTPQSALAQFVERPVAPAESALGPILPVTAPVTGVSLPVTAPVAASLTALSAAAALPTAAAMPVAAAAAAPSEARVSSPGSAAMGVAAEAQTYGELPLAAVPAAAPAVSRGLLGRIADAARGRTGFGAIFDGAHGSAAAERPASAPPLGGRLGLRELTPLSLPNGQAPDAPPSVPSPDHETTVSFQTYSLPGARPVGGVLEADRRTLAADPRDAAAVVAALRSMVDAEQARYGVAGTDLRLVHAKLIPGREGLADTMYVVFRQMKDGLLVHGSALSFTLKVIDGRPQVVAQTGQLFPQLDVDTGATMDDEDVRARIAQRTGLTPQAVADSFQFADEKIIYAQGQWRHVKLYAADGLPFMVAVDMAGGLVLAWDNRTGLRSGAKKDAPPSSAVSGRTVDRGPILPGAKISDLPLAFLNLTIGGKTYTTDKNGFFSAPGLKISPAGLNVTASLSGPYVTVVDQEKATLSVNVTLKSSGEGVQVVFNPDANLADENALAQVSAFHKVNLAYNFLKERGLTTERMDKTPIPVRSNLDDECNAYYTPGSPSLSFFRSSANCVNSAYDTVADHEYGHYWDDMTGGITNDGLSEGWGDTVSMYLLNNPVIGEHFMKHPGPDGKDYIRDGRNTYKYNEYDEAHDQGQAWGGFTWKLRAAMMQKLGDAAGAALAEALVLPTMFSKSANIPDAMAQVLVNAMKSDGTLAYEKEIRAIAILHGVTLPQAPRIGLVARLVEAVLATLRG
ncbi:MAG: hypothetical protein HKL90_12615 [Elusimicrobia bacterium]|nr:hypothetical protein [Elusimicrobiota bacterium]